MLNAQYSILNTQYSILNTQYLKLNTQYSMINTQYKSIRVLIQNITQCPILLNSILNISLSYIHNCSSCSDAAVISTDYRQHRDDIVKLLQWTNVSRYWKCLFYYQAWFLGNDITLAKGDTLFLRFGY